MPYINKRTGERKFTLKEKIKYHTRIANSGKKGGKIVPLTTRVRHANRATKCVNKLNKFMKQGSYYGRLKKSYRGR